MSVRRLVIGGPALRVAIVGALVARRCAGPDCIVEIVPHTDPAGQNAILLRPDWQRFHDEIGLPPDALGSIPSARPAFVYGVAQAEAAIPFGPFGVARMGAEFHHYWLRANHIAPQPELSAFSPSLALASRPMTLSEAAQTGLDFGLRVERDAYAALLLRVAEAAGARIVRDSEGDADLRIDCLDDSEAVQWSGGKVAIGQFPDVEGLEFQGLYDSTKRLLALSASPANSDAEQREFNRLSEAMLERMRDFAACIALDTSADSARPALRRKTDLFQACGRIAIEDYEVFEPHEWLALFWQKGMRPARHDRLADVMPERALREWLNALHTKAQALAKAEQMA